MPFISSATCTPNARKARIIEASKILSIVEHLDLQDIASFLNVHPNTISKIRRDITFEGPRITPKGQKFCEPVSTQWLAK